MDIALNSDMGESYGMYKMGDDDGLLEVINSANLACGFHAGDPLVMRRSVKNAKAKGISIGAHPAYPDHQGFGRRPMKLTPAEIEADVLYQIGALQAIAAAEGHKVTHVKPHGALNNQACEDADLAAAIARAIHALDPGLILLAPVLSELGKAGLNQGLPVAWEVFADRTYTDRATLTPRSQPDAMVEGGTESLNHIMKMIEVGGIVSTSGKVMKTPIHSICVHGDGEHALSAAKAVREGLMKAGVTLKPLDQMAL